MQYGGRSPTLKVLPHRPSVYSLAEASRSHGENAYPEPKMPDEFLSAIERILNFHGHNVKLLTHNELS